MCIFAYSRLCNEVSSVFDKNTNYEPGGGAHGGVKQLFRDSYSLISPPLPTQPIHQIKHSTRTMIATPVRNFFLHICVCLINPTFLHHTYKCFIKSLRAIVSLLTPRVAPRYTDVLIVISWSSFGPVCVCEL
jgi:hypothetical protein